MKRTVWATDQVANSVNAKLVPVMVDVDDPYAAAVVTHYGVVATPTTIIADSDGTLLQRLEGGRGEGEFLDSIGKVNIPGDKP